MQCFKHETEEGNFLESFIVTNEQAVQVISLLRQLEEEAEDEDELEDEDEEEE